MIVEDMRKHEDISKSSKITDSNHFVGYTFKAPVNMKSPEIESMLEKMDKEFKGKEKVKGKGKGKGKTKKVYKKPLPKRPPPENPKKE